MLYSCKKCGWSGEVRENNPRCLACQRAAVKRWMAKNREIVNAKQRRYDTKFRLENREEYNARRRRKRSPERMAEAQDRRRAWLLAGDVTREQLIQIYEANPKCRYCGGNARVRFTVSDPRGFDHVIPRAKGGRHTASNLVVCCKNCNSKKSDKIL